jgi:hypothetical protein
MKNLFRLFGIIALAAVIGFSFAACSDGGGDDDGDDGNGTATYTGVSGGQTYTLKITENTARYTAKDGDDYELTAGTNKSAGKVDNVAGSELTLKPSNATATFTATISGKNLTALNGTITWTDKKTTAAPGELIGTGGNSGGSSGSGWTAVTTNVFDGNAIKSIAYGGGKFVAGNNDGKMAYSSDGITWTAINTTLGTSDINAIIYANNKFVAVGNGGIATSTDGTTWTVAATTTVWGSSGGIKGIAYGNNRFVAVGAQGRKAYSTDGTTWTRGTGGNPITDLNAIAYGNNKFVAVGLNATLEYSSDNGATWTEGSFISYTSTNAIIYANNKFVAGANGGNMAYSTDGVTWTAVSYSTFGETSIRAIAYGNGKFVAGGERGKIATSTDGVTWTAGNIGDDTYGIAYGGGKFVAVGSKISYSTDGGGGGGTGGGTGSGSGTGSGTGSTDSAINGTWVEGAGVWKYTNGSFEVSINGNKTWQGTYTTNSNSITMTVTGYHGDAFTLINGNKPEAKWYSRDGYKALPKVGDTSDATLNEIFWTTTLKYSVTSTTLTFSDSKGNETNKYTKDTSGSGTGSSGTGSGSGSSGGALKWTAVSDKPFGSTNIYAIAYGKGKFVAVGGGGKTATSTDGKNWTAVTNTAFSGNAISNNINAITYGNDKFVAVGDFGTIAYSSDGATWTASNVGNTFDYTSGDRTYKAYIHAIAWGKDKFVAGSERGNIAYSSDGVTWTAVNKKFNVSAIAYGNDKFVVGYGNGSNGTMATSPNGITWTDAAPSTYDRDINAIAWGNNTFVTGGTWGTVTSPDGVTTSSRSGATRYIHAIAFGNGKFVAGNSSGKITTSSDNGVTWTEAADSAFGSGTINGIAFGNNTFVAVGDDGKMAYSTGN